MTRPQIDPIREGGKPKDMDRQEHNDVGGFGFGQRESLQRRLHNLLRDYPEGVGIVKELIQNADDAGATTVRLTVDWRSHSNVTVIAPAMAELMGPALLFYNNAKFTDADFANIQEISYSGKSNDLGKAGRYGIGFNSVYHVTDCPSIISGNRIVFFDPRCSYVPSSPLVPGHGWYYGEEGWWNRFPEFLAAYEIAGLPHGTTDFDGTVFRLPLRTPIQAKDNEIRHEPFTSDNVHRLLQTVDQDAEALLLFLKSVLTIEIYEIRHNDIKPQLRLSLSTINPNLVRNERTTLLSVVSDGYDTLTKVCRETPDLLPNVNYVHEIGTVSRTGKHISKWLITGVIYVDPDGELLKNMAQMRDHGDKAVPWGGAAARLSSTDKTKGRSFISGRAFCFLPLPVTTGLPLHIHGYFDLNSSRDGISTVEGRTGQSEIGPQWNRLLVQHVISRACANLVESLSEQIGESDPDEYYRQWPVQEVSNPGLVGLTAAALALVYDRPLLRSAGLERWISPSEISIVPNGWTQIRDPLVADSWSVPDPDVPEYIRNAFLHAGFELAEILPAEVREHLRTVSEPRMHVQLEFAPTPSLRKRLWILSLLRFCMSDNLCDIRGLPLALVADGALERFGDGHVIANEEERAIFATHLDWFIHPKMVDEVQELSSINEDFLHHMTLLDFVNEITTITDTVSKEDGQWRPTQGKLPNQDWLAKVYAYLSKQTSLDKVLDALRLVPLVPGDDARLHNGGTPETPLDGEGIQPELRQTLRTFGIVFVKADGDLRNAITTFVRRFPNALIPPVTGPDLVDSLAFVTKTGMPPVDHQQVGRLLDFLAGDVWVEGKDCYDSSRQQKLKSLPIWPTSPGNFVSLSGSNSYRPGGFEPPRVGSQLAMVNVGKDGRWIRLLDLLAVETLNRPTFVRKCLIPGFSELDEDEQYIALMWLRNNWTLAEQESLAGRSHGPTFLHEVASSALFRCSDGLLRSIKVVYSPDEKVVQDVFGTSVPLPDKEYFGEDWDRWSQWFRQLGWRTAPEPIDIIAHIDKLIERSRDAGPDSVAHECMNVYYHVTSDWDRYSKLALSSETKINIGQELGIRAWLPVLAEPEELIRFTLAIIPEHRLHRTSEVCFVQEANLAASKRAIFRVRVLPSQDVRSALGFREITPQEVADHYASLIDFWDHANENPEGVKPFQSALASIYNYFYIHFVSGRTDGRWLRERFSKRKCLWDNLKFWRADHAFQTPVLFFGSRRAKINPDERIAAVYRLLGQQLVPEAADYIAFLVEIKREFDGIELPPAEISYVIDVCKRLVANLETSDDNYDLTGLPILTAASHLLTADIVLVPDAPWRVPYVDAAGGALLQSGVPIASVPGGLSVTSARRN